MMQTQPKIVTRPSPFDLDDDATYQRWRDAKLKDYPQELGDLVVEIDDPRTLGEHEHAALLARCRKANMALYAGKTGDDPDPDIPLSLARRFGLVHINRNWLADETGLTSLTVREEGIRQHYIPYIYRGRLESGMGLVSNNVLHDRAAFSDDATHKRHYYRARYFDRLAGTDMAHDL